MSDKILFGMPEDPELFLAALAAVQDYGWHLVRQLEFKQRDADWVLGIHVPNHQLDFLRPCFPWKGDWFEEPDPTGDGMKRYTNPVDTTFVQEWTPKRGEWDFVYRFDPEVAYSISETSEIHAATAFGILIGAAPEPEFPSLDRLHLEALNGIAVLPFDGDQEMADLLEIHYPEFPVVTGIGDVFGVPYQYDMVIGPRSSDTYMAASLGKRVVELYPDDRHRGWLAKWGIGTRYMQMYGKEFPVGMIWRAVEEVIEQWRTTVVTT